MTNEDTKNRRGIVVVPTAIVARWVQTTSPGPVRAVVYFMAAPADKRRRRRERERECPYLPMSRAMEPDMLQCTCIDMHEYLYLIEL